MKNDIIKTTVGIGLLASVAFVAFKVFRRTTEGSVSRMKAPFAGPIFPYPITRNVVSSPFGEMRNGKPHLGIDLKTRFDAAGKPDPNGKPDVGIVIKSPFKGRVISVFTNDAGGLQMEVKADDGTIMGLAHLLTAQVAVGEAVDIGDVLAGTGASGKNINGPHLHLTVREPSGKVVDPAPYLGL